MEQEDAFLLYRYFGYLAERQASRGALGKVVLDFLQGLWALLVAGSHKLPFLVFHAEDEPGEIFAAQVGFVAQGGEVFAQFVPVEALLGFLELHHFVLVVAPQFVEYGRVVCFHPWRVLRCKGSDKLRVFPWLYPGGGMEC